MRGDQNCSKKTKAVKAAVLATCRLHESLNVPISVGVVDGQCLCKVSCGPVSKEEYFLSSFDAFAYMLSVHLAAIIHSQYSEVVMSPMSGSFCQCGAYSGTQSTACIATSRSQRHFIMIHQYHTFGYRNGGHVCRPLAFEISCYHGVRAKLSR